MLYEALMEEAGELTEAQLAETLDFIRFLKYRAGDSLPRPLSAPAWRDPGTAEEARPEELYVSGDFYETPSAYRRR